MSITPELLPIALRAFTEAPKPAGKRNNKPKQPKKKNTGRKGGRQWPEPQTVLVFDTETTTDQAQRLNFGVYRYNRWIDGKLVCVEEAIFHADELPVRDPEGFETLCLYVREHVLDTDADQGIDDARPLLYLISETEFRETLRMASGVNGNPKTAAVIAGFNLPFDLTRFALDWGPARSKKYASGFSLQLWDYEGENGERRESPLRPRLGIKHLGPTKALKGFIAPFGGHFLDLRTLVFALTNKGHSLASASKEFDVPGWKAFEDRKSDIEHGKITPEYIKYCREDVRASAELYERAMNEYRRHPIDLQATQAYSPASIGKSYLSAMGIRPRLELQPGFPRDVLGKAMEAYYGGRTECRIRRVDIPIMYTDFLSMYTTVNSLMGLWNYVTAARIEVVDATDEIRALVEEITVEHVLKPETWRQLPALVQIDPNGDVLPVRARYDDGRSWGIGSNPLHGDQPIWDALGDVIAAKILTGRSPKILQALRLVPVGRQRDLRPVKLRGEVEIDPRTQDFFRTVIEQRKALGHDQEQLGESLKVTANSTSYGIFAEMRRRELLGKTAETITIHTGSGTSEIQSKTPETPGRPGGCADDAPARSPLPRRPTGSGSATTGRHRRHRSPWQQSRLHRCHSTPHQKDRRTGRHGGEDRHTAPPRARQKASE